MIQTYQATVAAAAVCVATAGTDDFTNDARPLTVLVQNLSPSVNAWIGGSTVTASQGILVGPAQSAPAYLYQGEALYAIASAACDFRVMTSGVL